MTNQKVQKQVITNETVPVKYPQGVKPYKRKKRMKKDEDSMYNMLTDDEKALHDALVMIADAYGKFDEDGDGIWAGYLPPELNDNLEIGVKCGNCALYMGGNQCEIIAFNVEENGYCRFAVIPDGLVDMRVSEIKM